MVKFSRLTTLPNPLLRPGHSFCLLSAMFSNICKRHSFLSVCDGLPSFTPWMCRSWFWMSCLQFFFYTGRI